MDNSLSFLGIAKKAGFLAIGGESVSAAARSGKAKAVFSSADASDGAKRRARENSAAYGIVYVALPYTMFELGNVTGRGSPGTIAITDAGLAAAFLGKLAEKDPGIYGEAAGKLAVEAEKLGLRKRKRTAGHGDSVGRKESPRKGGLQNEYNV